MSDNEKETPTEAETESSKQYDDEVTAMMARTIEGLLAIADRNREDRTATLVIASKLLSLVANMHNLDNYKLPENRQTKVHPADRAECPMRNEANGNCGPAGGFCTANGDEICAPLQTAYNAGWCDAVDYIGEKFKKL